jgi:hypothetical protein
MFMVVGLLAFGEMVRRGRYHLDGGRGWDLPQACSLDMSHVRLPLAPAAQAAIRVTQHPYSPEQLIVLWDVPSLSPDRPGLWFGFRAPPQV